jgi:hypothetical protein
MDSVSDTLAQTDYNCRGFTGPVPALRHRASLARRDARAPSGRRLPTQAAPRLPGVQRREAGYHSKDERSASGVAEDTRELSCTHQ